MAWVGGRREMEGSRTRGGRGGGREVGAVQAAQSHAVHSRADSGQPAQLYGPLLRRRSVLNKLTLTLRSLPVGKKVI